MAYCVQCGVKLEEGAKECPLCHTKVLLPPSVQETKKDPLFPKPMPEKGSGGFNKTSKGVIELTLVLLLVSEGTIFFSMWFTGNLALSFVPMFCPLMAVILFLLAFVAKHSYVMQGTVQSVGVSVLLLGLDGSDWVLYWSLIAVGAILLFWILAVLPSILNKGKKRIVSVVLSILSIFGYLAFLNWLIKGSLTWFFPVAFPTVSVFLAGLGLMCLRFFGKNKVRLPLADLIFFSLIVIFLTISAADLFSTRYLLGFLALRWSVSMLAAAVILTLFLLAVSFSRRVRRYFTSQNRHS
jgi:hypothetical protein